MKRLLVAVLGLVLFAAVPASAAPKASADVVKVTPRQKLLTATPGQRITFQVALDIAPHWHLYAHGDTNFIGIDLDPEMVKRPLQHHAIKLIVIDDQQPTASQRRSR